VKMKLVDQSGGELICVVIPVQIESAARRQNVDQSLRFIQMH